MNFHKCPCIFRNLYLTPKLLEFSLLVVKYCNWNQDSGSYLQINHVVHIFFLGCGGGEDHNIQCPRTTCHNKIPHGLISPQKIRRVIRIKEIWNTEENEKLCLLVALWCQRWMEVGWISTRKWQSEVSPRPTLEMELQVTYNYQWYPQAAEGLLCNHSSWPWTMNTIDISVTWHNKDSGKGYPEYTYIYV